MKEIIIELDRLAIKQWELQMLMQKPFDYGRSPSNDEYKAITDAGLELRCVEHSIATLESVLDSIISNNNLRG